MASAALLAVAATAPKDLTGQGDHGKTKLHKLVIQCQAAGLAAPVDGSNDVALLHAFFDVALQHGLGSVVYDYVVEVAADKYCTSSDPIKAYLLDGECVKDWAHNALDREQSHLLQGLSRGLASLAGAGQLHKHVARLCALVLIIEALHPVDAEASSAQLPADLQLARQLHQCAMVLEWAAQHVPGTAGGPSRFESEPAWRMAVSKRRAAAAPDSTFLQDMQLALAEAHGCGPMQYPPASVEKAAQAIFLTGGTTEAAWQAKLAMLVYYLQDAGLPFLEQSFMHAFHVMPARLVEWTAYFHLDDALAGSRSSLDSTCARLSAAAGSDSSFKVAQSLAALGRPGDALNLLRARQSASRVPQEPDQALHEARISFSIRLSCNLLTEAVMEAQQHCNAVQSEQRAKHVRELVRSLADWAQSQKALNAVIQLPLNQLEEQMLVEWLEEAGQAGRPAGRYLVLLYLVRGRLPEALRAFGELRNSTPEAQTEQDGPIMALAALLESASALVPEQARAAAAGPPASSDVPQQHAAQLFCSSLLPGAEHGTQPAPSQRKWSKSMAAPEELQAGAAAAHRPAQAAPGAAQQRAPAAGADGGGASWAAWRADQRGEVGLCHLSHHRGMAAHPQPGKEPGRAFGQHIDGLEGAGGETGTTMWQHIIGPPGSRSAARTVKRPRVHRPR